MTANEPQFSCPIAGTLEIIAGKWKPEILWQLKDNTMRFNQLRKAIGGVSQKMLTQQLRELQRDGMIKRTQFEQIPPRVEYTSTELANNLKPLFDSLVSWSDRHGESVNKARMKYDGMDK